MGAIANALLNGFTATEIINFLAKSNKELKPKIEQAQSQGYTAEQIVDFLGGYERSGNAKKSPKPFAARSAVKPGYTDQERTKIANEYRPPVQKNIGGVLGSVLENAPALAGIGGLSYGFGKAAAPVGQIIGNYLSSKFSGGTSGPNSPAPAPNSPTPNSPIVPNSTPTAPNPTPISPSGSPKPSAGVSKTPGFIAAIVQGVAGQFGFRNKPLVNAVAKIVEETGKEVGDVYKELSERYDISTPEKATQAAQSKLKEIHEQQSTPQTLDQITAQKEQRDQTMQKIKPAKEVSEALTKDMKSSVIRKTEYDPAKNLLKVVFNNSHSYTYDDVPEEIYNKLTEGAIPAKTKGENEYGRWWVGKQPSTGAAFNQLIKKGGYNFTRGADSPLSEQEEEEYKELAGTSKDKQKSFVSGMQKVQATRKNIAKDLIEPEKVKFRAMAYRKTLEELRKQPQDERGEKLIQTIQERLKTLEQLDKLKNTKKSKILTEEVIRFEKAQGKTLLKKMLILLPASIVKVLKDKIENTDEKEILSYVKDYLIKKMK